MSHRLLALIGLVCVAVIAWALMAMAQTPVPTPRTICVPIPNTEVCWPFYQLGTRWVPGSSDEFVAEPTPTPGGEE